ncbi:RNA polymerase, sigma subunit, ECF family [Frankia sp. EI5c]|uniref:sigma-70 family RNA polymerase sigma factor n=1 Tax=Frankia sp. EI5c TaxID=683316 RepID=UPI0007C28A6A|nr:sigma-70 family RNA polymerase sigma factor [Frankia sp. EI5c]OAA28563.1 RNA polymerase, sigma subunit, ECF family [Frankia sp. EI5c]
MSEVLPDTRAGAPAGNGELAEQGVPGETTTLLEPFRPELTGYCYRMLGSPFDAQDAVQETMIRAWRGLDRFEGRAALRSWLYRIATNVCLTMLSSGQRRARPMDLTGPSTAATPLRAPLPEASWIVPAPDGRVLTGGADTADPADLADRRESVRLAFVVALQHLPARQRAVLILREVFAWSASETAQLLDTTVASVNSALQRARATIASIDVGAAEPLRPADAGQRALLARYVEAFERYDIEALVALMHEDVTLSMPPLDLWLRGQDDVRAWLTGTGRGCRGSRLLPTTANGHPAFGQYRPSETGAGHDPWGLIVLEIEGGRVQGVNTFLDVERLFPLFGLPSRLPG